MAEHIHAPINSVLTQYHINLRNHKAQQIDTECSGVSDLNNTNYMIKGCIECI